MEFAEFRDLLRHHVANVTKSSKLFTVELDPDELWDFYLDSFPAGTNEIFRERREFDCSCCRSFVKKFGNVVAIKDNQLITIWDFKVDDEKYQTVIDALAAAVKECEVTNVFRYRFRTIGGLRDLEQTDNDVLEWNHFYIEVPSEYVVDDVPAVLNEFRTRTGVFKRSLDTITPEALYTVLELIEQGSLYRGDSWVKPLEQFAKLQKDLNDVEPHLQNNFAWEQSMKHHASVLTIRNTSMGTLLINLSEGMDLLTAVKKYEDITAPENYQRPKAIFTQKMVKDAEDKLNEAGLVASLPRRFAALDDIKVTDVKFANRDVVKQDVNSDVFDEMRAEAVKPANVQSFDRCEEVGIDDFLTNIVPKISTMEALLDNSHEKNLMSLIAPANGGSKSLFKWNNGFSWAYSGNLTDSTMRENVKAAGGSVDGVLRFSIQWNDSGPYNPNDFDAHCQEPRGHAHIFFSTYKGRHNVAPSSGNLDVDIVHPDSGRPAVENITWSNKSKMPVGEYKMYVHNYSHNGGRTGFSAEIEFDGKIHHFEYPKELRSNQNVQVAVVKLDSNGKFSIKPVLESSLQEKEVWGVKTGTFVPVSLLMLSPNHWDGEKGIGEKHYFFMLHGCQNPTTPNGFFNEFLPAEFRPLRKFFEALGGKMKVPESDKQLSGIGFSSTKKESLICKVTGNFSRTLKIVF